MPKRRANGEGNIRKRKDGRWEGRYTAGYDPESRKRIIKNVLGKTQAEVKEKLKTAISESQRLDVSKAGNYTVASWVRTWYEVYAEPRIRPNTKAYYTNYIENHIIPGIGSIPLDKLTTIQIQRFYNNLQKTGRVQRKNFPELKDKSLSPRVVRGVHTLLHNCLEQAVSERLILANPAQGCKLPQLEKREMKILPQEKIGLYLAEAEKRGLLAAFYLELTTGLRRGELLALQWTDLDVESKTLSITKQVNRINGELVVSPPKTRNSVRTLALPQQAVDLLIAEHKKHSRNPYMFPSPKTGTMYDPDAFRRTHDKILKAIGAEHIRFHDLRHTFATLSLKSGVDVKTLSGALGHYSAGFTLNTYTHATAQMKQDAADTIVPGIGSIPLDKLTTIQIQRFYNNLQKSGRVQRKNFPELRDKSLSPRVARGVHTLLHNCLEQAVAERLILTNPAQGCKLPQLEKKEMKILPQEKIGMYLAEAEKQGLLAAFYLELTTGLRRGELLALQWTDLDVESKTLSITKQVNRINGELVVSPPKTRNSVRTLALPQQAVDLLIAEHQKHPRNPYLFPSPKTGTMYDPDAFRRTHDKILKAIGAEHIRFHDLRHTFATLSLKSGVDVKTLSGALGHYSAGFTLNTYTHATAQMKQDAANTIGGVISQQMR